MPDKKSRVQRSPGQGHRDQIVYVLSSKHFDMTLYSKVVRILTGSHITRGEGHGVKGYESQVYCIPLLVYMDGCMSYDMLFKSIYVSIHLFTGNKHGEQ